jgi:hypothetical protein
MLAIEVYLIYKNSLIDTKCEIIKKNEFEITENKSNIEKRSD